MRKYLSGFLMVFATGLIVMFLLSLGSAIGMFMGDENPKVGEDSILEMNLEGIILDGDEFLEKLSRYRKDDKIKGVLLTINSPGGVVGPSQEIYSELKRVRDEFQKPVVAVVRSVAASGAYYAAVAADQIIVTPGALMGSIGVIMEFNEMDKFYKWVQMNPYVIKTGAYKDSGSAYRKMRDDERKLFQDLIDNVHEQFKTAVEKSRKLNRPVVDKYGDGRIFTGEDAVKLGFADQVGTYEDALKTIGELAGLGTKPKVFKPPKKSSTPSIEFFVEFLGLKSSAELAERLLRLDLKGKPLYLMPGSL